MGPRAGAARDARLHLDASGHDLPFLGGSARRGRAGHEWAIPRMFPYLVQGIERSVAVPLVALEYFRLHIDLDVEHGRALEAALLRWATTDANQEELRRGARRSLDARAAFWSALAEQLFPEARDLGLEGSQLDRRAS